MPLQEQDRDRDSDYYPYGIDDYRESIIHKINKHTGIGDIPEGVLSALKWLEEKNIYTPPTRREANRDKESVGLLGVTTGLNPESTKILNSVLSGVSPEALRSFYTEDMGGLGRGEDSEMAHVAPGERVIPPNLSPETDAAIDADLASLGIDPVSRTVGPGANINPRTGKPEFQTTTEQKEPGVDLGALFNVFSKDKYPYKFQTPEGLESLKRVQAYQFPDVAGTSLNPWFGAQYGAGGAVTGFTPQAQARYNLFSGLAGENLGERDRYRAEQESLFGTPTSISDIYQSPIGQALGLSGPDKFDYDAYFQPQAEGLFRDRDTKLEKLFNTGMLSSTPGMRKSANYQNILTRGLSDLAIQRDALQSARLGQYFNLRKPYQTRYDTLGDKALSFLKPQEMMTDPTRFAGALDPSRRLAGTLEGFNLDKLTYENQVRQKLAEWADEHRDTRRDKFDRASQLASFLGGTPFGQDVLGGVGGLFGTEGAFRSGGPVRRGAGALGSLIGQGAQGAWDWAGGLFNRWGRGPSINPAASRPVA